MLARKVALVHAHVDLLMKSFTMFIAFGQSECRDQGLTHLCY